MYFQNYGLRKKWLDEYLKSPLTEDPKASNMVKRPKNICNLDGSTFTIFIDRCKRNWVGKSFF